MKKTITVKVITLTTETLQAIADARFPDAPWIQTAIDNADGTWDIPVDDDVIEALEALGPDHEATILRLLGKKPS